MTIGSRYSILNNHELVLTLDNNGIQTSDSFKLLEIPSDQMLTWNKQIDSVCLNITRKITLMKMLSKYVNQDTRNCILTLIYCLCLTMDVSFGVIAQPII